MKKFIFLSIALAFIIGLGFTTCKDDGENIDDFVVEFCEKMVTCSDAPEEEEDGIRRECFAMIGGTVIILKDAGCERFFWGRI